VDEDDVGEDEEQIQDRVRPVGRVGDDVIALPDTQEVADVLGEVRRRDERAEVVGPVATGA